MDYCAPHVELHEGTSFTDAQALEVAKSLSLNDPHYASFLLELAVWMKLFTKMPSLYVHRMQLSKKCEEFFAQSDEDILRDIIDATVSMTACALNSSVPLPENIFTESFIRSLLVRPMETDDIFSRVLDVLGYDLDDVLDITSEPMPEGVSLESLGYDMEMLSGTFVMGIVLDRFFFTPFGHFLRLIRPLYVLPFDFATEIRDYVDVCEDPEESFVAFFAPCSSYTLTDLGLEILGVEPTSDNCFDTSVIPFEIMENSIFTDIDHFDTFVKVAQAFSPILAEGLPALICTFRVRLEAEAAVWMHLEVPENLTLQHLYDEIAEYFDLKRNDDFSFFHDKTENRFAEYPSARRAVKAKNPRKPACQVFIDELDFDHMSHMILAAYGQAAPFSKEPPTVRLLLERISIKPSDPGIIYPAIGRMSKEMKQRFTELE